jgi:hypothetical protein
MRVLSDHFLEISNKAGGVFHDILIRISRFPEPYWRIKPNQVSPLFRSRQDKAGDDRCSGPESQSRRGGSSAGWISEQRYKYTILFLYVLIDQNSDILLL